MDPRLALAIPVIGYLIALATIRAWTTIGLLLAAIVLAAVLIPLSRRVATGFAVAAAWAPLHLLLIATGSLGSPLLPLTAVWVVGLGWFAPRAALGAAAWVGLVVPAVQWARDAPAELVPLIGLGILLGIALGVHRFRSRLIGHQEAGVVHEPRTHVTAAAPTPVAAPDALSRMLRLAAWATGADDGSFWTLDSHERLLLYHADAGLQTELDQTSPAVPLEGHPFGWAFREQIQVRLERGRQPLPSPWASEMLLVPVDGMDGLLVLAFRDAAPAGVEAVALDACRHLSEMLSLLRGQGESRANQERVHALVSAARSLSGELQTEGFADLLSRAVRKTTGAQGTAVALWNGDLGRGEMIHIAGEADAPVPTGTQFRDGESRIGLAMKHGISLWFDDVAREPEKLPLCAEGERWERPPRSLQVVPLLVGGTTVGAVAAWHSEAGWFGEEEREYLELLGSVAPSSLQNAQRYEELYQRASTDGLTGLPNRSAFEMRFAVVAAQFQRYGRPVGIILLDIDHFKQFNDRWGHEAGDDVLRHVGHLLRSTVREVDLPARLGGEEFVVLLPETALVDAIEAAERIRVAIQVRPLDWKGRTLDITASLGVACCPECSGTPRELLGLADAALYASKAGGRNRVTAAPEAELAGK